MNGAQANYDQRFYLNGEILKGITSLGGSISLGEKPINTIGVGCNSQVISEVPTANFNVERYLIYKDPFLKYTGENQDRTARSFSASLGYGDKIIGFESGYLDSFSISCSVGQVPQTSSSISVFGDVGSGFSASGNALPPYVTVPQTKSITIQCSGSNSNRVVNFDYSINCPKKAIYGLIPCNVLIPPDSLISHIPEEVVLDLPIEVTANFTLEIDDFESKRLYEMLVNNAETSFSITIKGEVLEDVFLSDRDENIVEASGHYINVYQKLNETEVFSASFDNAKLISKEFSSQTEDVLSVKLGYKTYLN